MHSSQHNGHIQSSYFQKSSRLISPPLLKFFKICLWSNMFKYGLHLPNGNFRLKRLPLQPVLIILLIEIFDLLFKPEHSIFLTEVLSLSLNYAASLIPILVPVIYFTLLCLFYCFLHFLSHLPCWIVRVDTVTMKSMVFFLPAMTQNVCLSWRFCPSTFFICTY